MQSSSPVFKCCSGVCVYKCVGRGCIGLNDAGSCMCMVYVGWVLRKVWYVFSTGVLFFVFLPKVCKSVPCFNLRCYVPD